MDIAIPGPTPPWVKSHPITVAVDPVALVVTECITVTSAMRKHARWAHSSVSAILGGSASSSRLEILKPAPSSRKMSTPKAENGASVSPTPSAPASGEEVGLASRWGLRGKKGQSMQDNPLLSAFAKLRSDLKQCKDIHSVDGPAILHPFLQVIRSSSTSAPITSLALIAITKFFAYGIISRKSPQLPLAMQLLSSAVTHCRFEASDSATDEIVLFRILKLMEGMITGPGGEVLGDESMCEMMETGISMCCQVRLSELLRRSAEVSMVTMCQTIFQRLKILEVEPELPIPRRSSSKPEADAVKMDPTIDNSNLNSPQSERKDPSRDSEESQDSQESEDVEKPEEGTKTMEPPLDKGGGEAATPSKEASQIDLTQHAVTEESVEIKPYALPSIRELFRVLVGLLDPHDRQHNDTMRVMALRIVDVALEVAGPSIANHPSLALLAKDTLCRHLFQLVRSENIVILNESLRVAGTLLSTCRRVLKLQQELFLSYLVACLHPRVEIPQEPGVDPALYDGVPQAPRLVKSQQTAPSSGRSTPVPIKDRQKLGMEGGTRKPDAREAMVESVGALVRLPSFMAELFVNYDCEIDRGDLCLDMVGLLSRNAFPDAATWSTTNVPPLCLDALLGYIHSIAERLEDGPLTEGFPDVQALRKQRALKKIITKGASKFNDNPKAGLAFLAAQNVISNVEDPRQVAEFLKGTTRVDKKVLGDFLSKRGHEDLLTAFIETFDFTDSRVDEALRQLLNSFRLPGEAQLIERIVTEFARQYFPKSGEEDIADQDAVFVLTYAIIILNTDQHSPKVRNQARMASADFAKNLRGVNGGKDFNPEYLQEIYDSIKNQEIVLPEEHDNKHSFDHAWKELLFKIQSTSDLTVGRTNVFDADMFAATWKPVVATLSYVFLSATDDTVFSRVVTGFDQCAQIASKYGLHEALDHIIFCLSSISTLATSTLPSTALNTDVQAGEKSIMVSETAVRFGRDFKAQLATVVLFRVVVGNELAIREGWTHLIRITLNLFVNSLLGAQYASISSNADLPTIPLQSPAQVIDRDRAADSGLFSAFTSYVSSFANDEPPEPSDQEIEYTLATVDCVSACAFDQFFANISKLPIEPLQAFLEALLTHLPEDATPQVIVVKPEMPAPKAVRPNGQKSKSVGLAYDPSIVFVLELATILSARDPDTMSKFGKQLSGALQAIVRDAAHMHAVTVSRAVYYLLSFLRASHDYDFVRAPVVLHIISKFDQDQFNQAGSNIAKGLTLCLNGAPGLRNEMINSPDFWSVIRSLQAAPETAHEIFSLVQNLLETAPTTLTTDNYDHVVSLLNDFAAAGSIGAVNEQRRDQAAARGKPLPKEQTPNETVVRGVKAIQTLYQLTSRVPHLVQQSQLEPKEAWATYWPPIFRTLTTHSLNPCRQIRGQSLSSLSRVLLSNALSITSGPPRPLDTSRAISLFTEVIFPLIAQLLKPEIWQSDPAGMGETRLQAAVVCCKVFVRYLDTLLSSDALTVMSSMSGPLSPTQNVEGTSFPLPDQSTPTTPNAQASEPPSAIDGIRLWSHVLQVLERLIKAGGESDGLEEAIPESLKNVVLVMASDGYLVPPAAREGEERTAQQKRLWKVTFVRLERFQPGLMDGIFPGAGRETPRPSPTPQPAQLATAEGEKKEDEDEDETADAEEVPAQGESEGNVEEKDKGHERKSSEETVIVEKQEN